MSIASMASNSLRDDDGRAEFRLNSPQFNPEREEKDASKKLFDEMADQLFQGKDPSNFSLSNFEHLPPALMALVLLKKSEEEQHKQNEQFQMTWAAKLEHHLEENGTKELESAHARMLFVEHMQEIDQKADTLLNEVHDGEAETLDAIAELKSRSLHIHHGDRDFDLVRSADGKSFVDFNTGMPIPEVSRKEIADALMQFEKEHPGQLVATYPESKELREILKGFTKSENDTLHVQQFVNDGLAKKGTSGSEDALALKGAEGQLGVATDEYKNSADRLGQYLKSAHESKLSNSITKMNGTTNASEENTEQKRDHDEARTILAENGSRYSDFEAEQIVAKAPTESVEAAGIGAGLSASSHFKIATSLQAVDTASTTITASTPAFVIRPAANP